MPWALIPILEWIGVASAGLFLSACAGSRKDPRTPPSPQPVPPEPVLGFTEKDNGPAYRLYQEIVRAGAPPSLKIFDRGYQVINYGYPYPQGGIHCADPKIPFCVKGRDDGVVSPEEVWDFALHEEEKYRFPLQKVLGRHLSWVLEDYNPKDSFDVEQRRPILAAIKFIENLLEKQGVKPGSSSFQEKLAVALCFLVAVPNPKKMEEHRAQLNEFLKVLDTKGLGEWKNYLWENGGLALGGEKKEDELLELTALEARRIKKGHCTEMSKILYAVLKLAKLQPIFVNVNLWRTDLPLVREKLNYNPAYGHVCVALRIGDQILLLDSSLVTAQPPHEEYYLLSLRHFLSLEQINYAEFWHWKGDRKKTVEQFQHALSMDPANPLVYFARGIQHSKRGEYDEAIADFTEGLKLNPFYSVAFMLRGQVYSERKDWVSALADLDRAIALQPNMAHAYYGRGLLWSRQMEWARAIPDYNKAINHYSGEDLFFKQRGKAYANLEKWEEAVGDFKKVLELDPEDKESNLLLGAGLNRTNRWSEALTYLNKYLSQVPLDPEGFDQRGLAWGLSGQWDKALSDFNEAFRLSNTANPAHLIHRGIAWLQVGEMEKCRQDFSSFLKLFPREEPALVGSLAGTFEYLSRQTTEDSDLKKSMAAETGLEISKAKAQAIMAGVYWEIGEKRKALERFQVIFDAGMKSKPSPSKKARKFFKELFQYLPGAMKKEPSIQTLWKNLLISQPSPNSLSLR